MLSLPDDTLLEVNNLNVVFHQSGVFNQAVKDVSFNIKIGEIVGIVGESGSGKTVTCLSIMHLIPSPPGKISGGQMLFRKKDNAVVDLNFISREEIRKIRGNEIGMIFQEPMTSLNPVMKCGEQVAEAILLHKKVSYQEAKKQTIELFNIVNLPYPKRTFDKYPHELSGGQKQRVMIAMAMSCNPSLIIADEPTTALDVTIQKGILEQLKKLRDEFNTSVIFISHDLSVIAEIADKVMVMLNGNIVEKGTIDEIFTNPQHPYTKGLLACRPPLDKRLKVLPVINDFMEITEAGDIIEKPTSLESILKNVVISEKERADHLKVIYEKDKLIQIKNLHTWFPINKSLFGSTNEWFKAVNGINLDIYEGETLGLVGESGCGKTTLGRTILKLVQAKEGQILYRNEEILRLKEKDFRPLRKEMQIIFQDPYSSLNPRISIGEAVMEPMEVFGIGKSRSERKEMAMELLKKVGLKESHFNRFPHEFSGGQRQRICIARTLSVQPKFIICDESVSALDVSVQAQILNLLNDLKKEFNLTYIFISHDLSVVRFMSDRIAVMNKGIIEEIGDADQIYFNPQKEYTKKLINSIPKGKIQLKLNGNNVH
ncbi:MAG: ABC transporter ATP-binding protein [Bacteroidia bacterium]|nr:MAG: ABC transporter ATP-binding protein [Bacteroidia bacterium]